MPASSYCELWTSREARYYITEMQNGSSLLNPMALHQERLLAGRVEAQEMANAAVAGDLISRKAVEFAIADIISRTRLILQSLPGKIAGELAETLGTETSAIIPILRREVVAALRVLSKQEADEADRVARAVQAGVERGVNAGIDGGPDTTAEDERAAAPRQRVAPQRAGANGSSGERQEGDGSEGLRAALRSAIGDPEDPGRRRQPARRRGRQLGSTV